jgi:MATE family multidrug resistance protein
VIRRAWPIIVANATVPMLGLIDTAVIGNTGSVIDLGAIALGGLVFNFLYWGLGFLRMGTTGFIAQAAGAGDEPEVRAVLGRALVIASAIGLAIVLLKIPIAAIAMRALHGSSEVETVATRYVAIRLWAAPATLATLAVRGTLIGLGYSRELLVLETTLNGANLLLNLTFVGLLRWGASGVALGTALAEWLGLLLSLWIVRVRMRERSADNEPFFSWQRIWRRQQLQALLAANGDIMLRTLLMLLGFAWFTDQSARFGDSLLAANHVLLQFLSFSAFFLDGYANVAEGMVGAAIGAGRRSAFDLAVRRSSELAVASAAVLAMLLWAAGPSLIDLLTGLAPVRAAARAQLPLAAAYTFLSVAAFQLDGIFVGATRTRAMRNASFISASAFVIAAWTLARTYGNRGLWLAFILFVVARAIALGLHYPALRRSIPTG